MAAGSGSQFRLFTHKLIMQSKLHVVLEEKTAVKRRAEFFNQQCSLTTNSAGFRYVK